MGGKGIIWINEGIFGPLKPFLCNKVTFEGLKLGGTVPVRPSDLTCLQQISSDSVSKKFFIP